MFFQELFFSNLPLDTYPEFFARIVVACFCGGMIGYERSRRMKAAGIRTHSLIAAACALLVVISKYGFADLTESAGAIYESVKGADPSRIASQVISGVSFLGAGVIFVKGGSVKGLTTAAGIWATAAVGMAIGSGMHALGLFSTILVLTLQIVFHILSVGDDAYMNREITIEMNRSDHIKDDLSKLFSDYNIQVVSSKITNEGNDRLVLHLSVRMTKDLPFQEALQFMEDHPYIKSLTT